MYPFPEGSRASSPSDSSTVQQGRRVEAHAAVQRGFQCPKRWSAARNAVGSRLPARLPALCSTRFIVRRLDVEGSTPTEQAVWRHTLCTTRLRVSQTMTRRSKLCRLPMHRATPRTRTAFGRFVRRSILPGWAGSIFAGRVSQDGPDDLCDVTTLSVKCFRWTARRPADQRS